MVYDISFDEENPRLYRLAEVALPGELSVVEVGYNRVPKGLKQVMRRDVYILHYITSGKGRFMNCAFSAGDAYVVIPEEEEILEADAESTFETYWVMFRGVGVKRIFKSAQIPLRNTVFSSGDVSPFVQILKEAVFDVCPKNSIEEAYFLQSALYRILSLHLQNAKGAAPYVSETADKVKEFIDNHYAEDIRIEDLAKRFKYSRSHLHKIFKAAYGSSVIEYILSVRIEKAKLLLGDARPYTISEIAFAVGFNDPLYFSRIFKDREGVSPSAYRKKAMNKKESAAL